MPTVERLKRRLALSLKARKFDAALGALLDLESIEPREPSWPRRAARLFRAQADRKGEVAALRRALELQVDRSQVLDAIASCKALLEILPNDPRALETLDLLYLEGGSSPDARGASGAGLETGHGASNGQSDGPLETIRLTEVVPGAVPLPPLGGVRDEAGAIHEIPIESAVGEDEEVLDLRLESSSSADLRDLAAAQTVCLPSENDDSKRAKSGRRPARASDRGASLRSELANIPLFGELDPASLHTLIRRVRVVSLEAGQVLFRQGDPANTLYVVVDGAVVPIAEGSRRRKLAVLERGEFFGEIGLVAKQPRNATIEALVESKLLAIDRRMVRELITSQPSVAKGILRFLRTRLVDRQIRTNLFFAAFGQAERESVARQFRFLEVEAGTTVVEQGHAPDGLFVVLSGALAVVDRETDKEKRSLGLSDVFGGLSLIDGRPAPAAIVARSKCWLVVLGESRFRRILDANPRLDRVLRRLAAEGRTGTEREQDQKPV